MVRCRARKIFSSSRENRPLWRAEYPANWLKLLKDDNRAIFTAARKVSQAADYLRAFSEQVAEAA